MKKILFITLCLTACKSRQVVTDHSTVTTQIDSVSIKQQQILKIDTGVMHTKAKTTYAVSDSSYLEITPDTGSIQSIQIRAGESFTYLGKAKSINWRQKKSETLVKNVVVQQRSGITLKSNLIDSGFQKRQTTIHTTLKTSQTKSNQAWIWLTVGLFTIFILCSYVYFRLKQ